MLFCKKKIKAYRNKASNIKRFPLVEYLVKDMSDRIICINKKFNSILDIGARDGPMTNILMNMSQKITATDISESLLTNNKASFKIKEWDEDIFNFLPEGSYDLITSFLNLHLIEDMPNFLNNVASKLSKDGFFFASFYGENTLRELRFYLINLELDLGLSTTPRLIPMIRTEDIIKLLQTKCLFKNVIADIHKTTLKYESIFDLIKYLRLLGESNCMPTSPINKSVALFIGKNSIQLERLEVTFDIITIQAWN